MLPVHSWSRFSLIRTNLACVTFSVLSSFADFTIVIVSPTDDVFQLVVKVGVIQSRSSKGGPLAFPYLPRSKTLCGALFLDRHK